MSDALYELFESQQEAEPSFEVPEPTFFSEWWGGETDDATRTILDAVIDSRGEVFISACKDFLAVHSALPDAHKHLLLVTQDAQGVVSCVLNLAVPSNAPGHMLQLPMIDAGAL